MKKLIAGILIVLFIAAFVFYAIQTKPSTSISVKNTNTNYITPDTLEYSIVKTYPHDTSSFTQGLIIYKNKLYEGTGENGRSKLLEVDLNNGKALREVSL
ncbi:MAG: glutaminyl-peptide cyclotransferase, partial [Bacteroidota bacterium]